jgi:putative salt-induced outer membrane protein
VGTSGNSDTATIGADLGLHRRWPKWQLEVVAAAVRTTSDSVTTAEHYLGAFRGQRKLTSIVALSAGERAERDQLSGIDLRSTLDGGLNWTLVRATHLSLDAVTSIAWEHEDRTIGPSLDHPVGLLQVSSRIPLGSSAATTQRFAYYPDFQESSAYRSEAEIAAEAAMNSHLALKFAYLWSYSHQPVPGFKKSDGVATASLVVSWRAATPAP